MICAFLRLSLALFLPFLSPLSAAAQTSAQTAAGQGDEIQAPPGFWDRDTLTGDWAGWRSRMSEAGVTFSLQEQSEGWGNIAGGLRGGVDYNGLTTAGVQLDLGKLAGWSGAAFFVSAYQIHGRSPTSDLVGNLQPVSNIEATRDTKLYQIWIEQKLLDGRLTIRLGQEGANDEMMLTQYGALFLNSSFGFPALLAVDLPSGGPNYPLAAPMVRTAFQATDQITLVAAAFNGDPAPPGTGDPQLRDKGGTAFRLNDHVLTFGEFWYSTNQGDEAAGLPGTYKLGAWFDSSHFPDQVYDTTGLSLAKPESNGLPRGHSTGFAVYGIIDQMVWRKTGSKDQGVGLFLQVMGAPESFNVSNLFIAGGLNWKGPFDGRDNDVFGFGISYLGISPSLRHLSRDLRSYREIGSLYASNETVFEATYLYQVAPWWTMQPDLQVVANPGAAIPTSSSPRPLKNSVVAGFRATITF